MARLCDTRVIRPFRRAAGAFEQSARLTVWVFGAGVVLASDSVRTPASTTSIVCKRRC